MAETPSSHSGGVGSPVPSFVPRQRLTCEVQFTFKREAIFIAVFFLAQLLLGLLLALLVPRFRR